MGRATSMTDGFNPTVPTTDVAVGDTGPEVVIDDISRKDFVQYSGASGDFNPLHYDEPYAIEAGNRSVFAQGMLIAGFASRMLTGWFGPEAIKRFRIRFQAQVWPGDSVTVTGTVTDVGDTDSYSTAEVEVIVTNQKGDQVLTGDATAVLV